MCPGQDRGLVLSWVLGQLEKNIFLQSMVVERNLALGFVDLVKLLVVNYLVGVVQAVLLLQNFYPCA